MGNIKANLKCRLHNPSMGEMLNSKREFAQGPISETVSPRASRTAYDAKLRECYSSRLMTYIGHPYGRNYQGGQTDCTKLVQDSLATARSELGASLSVADKLLMANGGRIAQKLNSNGFRFEALTPQQTASSLPQSGAILLRITRASGAAEIRKWYAAGDVAICKGKNGEWATIGSKEGALRLIGAGGEVYLTRHLVSVVEENNQKRIVHATSDSRKKVVSDDPGKYLFSKYNANSLFISVNPAQLFPMPSGYQETKISKQ
jgi:hypothetical protein